MVNRSSRSFSNPMHSPASYGRERAAGPGARRRVERRRSAAALIGPRTLVYRSVGIQTRFDIATYIWPPFPISTLNFFYLTVVVCPLESVSSLAHSLPFSFTRKEGEQSDCQPCF